MVPGAYISIPQIPMTTTNKTDRRALRELGGSKTLEELTRLQLRGRDRRAPDTPMERRLRDLWSAVLQIDPASIGADSSFLRIGGESIAAMRLVAAARAAGLSLTVAHIFKAPRLCDLALLVKEVGSGADEQIPRVRPFALLKTQDPEAFVARYIAPAVEGGRPAVQDVVPATDFQEQSVADALQDPPGRYPHWTFDLPTDVDFARLRQACVELVNHYDILRSVFVRAEGRLWQVVLASLDPAYDTIDAGDADMATLVNSVCEQDIKRPRVLGRSFIRFIAVKHASGRYKFIFRISHAQFDGFSWASVLETLWSIYRGDPPAAGPSFTQYVAHAESTRAEAQSYWRSLLRGSPAPVGTRPNLLSAAAGSSSNLCSPANRLTVKETIAVRSSAQDRSRDGASLATLFHAACALVLARRHKLREVVFGRLVTGRSMLPGRLQEVVGPTMAEVPIRAVVEADDTVAAVAARLQAQFIEGAAHEAVGMVRIIEGCTGWAAEGVRDFGWRTAFQQPEDGRSSFLGRPSGVGFYEGAVPSRVRSEIYATPVHGDRLELEFEGNKRFVSEEDVREVFAGLRDALS